MGAGPRQGRGVAHMSTCAHCGTWFAANPRFPSAKLCRPCWVRRENALIEVDRLTAENATLRRQLADQLFAPRTPWIPPDMLRLLVLLAHPDRHANSDASNRATTWLLDLRQRADDYSERSR